MSRAPAPPRPPLPRRVIAGGLAVLILLAALVLYAGRGQYRQMETHSGLLRQTTSIFGITWHSAPQTSEISPLLDPPQGEEQWITIAGGSWGSRENHRWGAVAIALLNAVEWMNAEHIPAPQQRQTAHDLMAIARRDGALHLGFQDDRMVARDLTGETLLECVRPASAAP